MEEQGGNLYELIRLFLQSVQPSSFFICECTATDLAAIALPFLGMDDDVTFSKLPSCWAVSVLAKLISRVHRWAPWVLVNTSLLAIPFSQGLTTLFCIPTGPRA